MPYERIDLVNDIWSMSLSDDAWLHRVAVGFGATMPRSVAATAFVGDVSDGRFRIESMGSVVDHPQRDLIRRTIESTPPDAFARTVRVSPDGLLAFRTGRPDAARHHGEFNDTLQRMAARDTFTIGSVDGDGACVMLTAAESFASTLHANERRAWLRVAAHLGAAARLRRAARLDLLRSFDVLLERNGEVAAVAAHRDPAPTLRELLRGAVASAEASARLHDRGYPAEALALREALWQGRWSVVDVWDSDGRRYYAAVENPAAGSPLRELTAREREVAAMCATDAPLKAVAADLGLTESVVSRHLGTALRKLGLPTRADLVRAAAARRVLGRLERDVAVGPTRPARALAPGVGVLVSSIEPGWLAALTPAERRVAQHIVDGDDDEAIARALSISPRTVQNHTASVFKKLGVGSRVQLVAAMTGQLQP